MDILLKYIGVLLLMLCNKENVWILCKDSGPESYSLPTGNKDVQKQQNQELSDLFSSEKNMTDQVKPNTVVSGTSITENGRSHESIVHMEGGGDVTLHQDISRLDASSLPGSKLLNPSSSFNDSFPVVDHDNRSSSIVPRKGVTYKPKIVARKGVDSGSEENSSSVSGSSIESTDDNTEKNNDFLDKKCVCCSNSTFNVGNSNNSDKNCQKCCGIVKDGRNTSISASSVSNVTEPMNVLPADSPASAGNLTSQDSTLQNTSDSVNLDKHKSSSLNRTAAIIPPARNKKPMFTLDAVNDLPANLSSQSVSHSTDFSRTDYVIPLVLVIMAIPLVIVLALFLYKKGSEFWERRHYRRMDFLIDGMYNE